jgi:hypothetical protein
MPRLSRKDFTVDSPSRLIAFVADFAGIDYK